MYEPRPCIAQHLTRHLIAALFASYDVIFSAIMLLFLKSIIGKSIVALTSSSGIQTVTVTQPVCPSSNQGLDCSFLQISYHAFGYTYFVSAQQFIQFKYLRVFFCSVLSLTLIADNFLK